MLGLVASWWGAVLALPAAVLIGFAFAAVGMAATTYMKSWTDFDVVQVVVVPLFLFSATFYPLSTYPEWAQWVVRCTPLYQGVDLLRSLLLGTVGIDALGHVAYLGGDGGGRPARRAPPPRQAPPRLTRLEPSGMGLEGRVALVTGGGRGIGASICLALAEDGADVAVNYRRSADDAAEVVAAVEKLGRRAIAVAAAVEDEDADAAMVDRVVDELGGISTSSCTTPASPAGGRRWPTPTPTSSLASSPTTPSVPTPDAAGASAPARAGRDGGRADVVFISSIATHHPRANGAPYTMGKAAMEALAFTLAQEERKNGVHVNIVAPGLVHTEMGRRLVKSWGADIDAMDAGSPFGRVCTPDDVADVVRWLVSDGAGYVTGARI